MVDNNHSGSTCNPIKYLLDIQSAVTFRAGGNDAAGMAMALPVLKEIKWRHFDSNLHVGYKMASWPFPGSLL